MKLVHRGCSSSLAWFFTLLPASALWGCNASAPTYDTPIFGDTGASGENEGGTAPHMDATTPTDRGSTPTDNGPPRDAGTPPRDTGSTPTDTGSLPPPPPPPPPPPGGTLRSFPGAEGFGATATGGRGGRVIYVTNLNADGPGSLNAAVQTAGPKYILFKVSGVINADIQITQADAYIAGQTSPGGVVVHGIHCDNVYDRFNCHNIIMRHVRSRNPDEDCIRMGGTYQFIIDHCSFENAGDESIELSRSHDITVQYSVIAEPVGDHYLYGGLLINYSKDIFQQDNLSIHHNVWNGCHGRLPEISCEENGDGPGNSNCSGHVLHIELDNNVLFDIGDPIWYNRCVGVNAGNDCNTGASDALLQANWVNNIMMRRGSVGDWPMFANEVGRGNNQFFYSGNTLINGGRTSVGAVPQSSRSARFAYPAVTVMPTAMLTSSLQASTGAFPRDTMDRRLAGYLSAPVESRPPAWTSTGINRGDGNTVTPPAFTAPTDTDNDGMPDDFERTNGLNPAVQDHNGTDLSMRFTGVTGYTNLECYLNALSDERVRTGR